MVSALLRLQALATLDYAIELAKDNPECKAKLDAIAEKWKAHRLPKEWRCEPYVDDGGEIPDPDIVVSAQEIKQIGLKTGCYLWVADGEIVRAGQSIQLRQRLMSYRLNYPAMFEYFKGKTRVEIRAWYVHDIDAFEMRLIARFKPRFNKRGI